MRNLRVNRSVRSMGRSPGLIVVAVWLAMAAGCIEREGRPVNPCTNVTIGQAIQVNNVDKVDLLFMVDNSNSMTEEQASLAAEFPRMIQILASGDFELDGCPGTPGCTESEDDFEAVRDLNVGVITSDMGTAGHVVPTCARSDFGDDGILRTQGNTATGTGCMATYPTFLNFRPDSGGDPLDFATDVACVAVTGTGGCGFEQQLEAMLKAGSPTTPQAWTADGYEPPTFFRNTFGHGDTENLGFFRENAVLALIPVTDEEDCSAFDGELFNQTSTIYTTNLNLRCFLHGNEALHPISRYVDGFIRLRQREGLLIYAPIVGIPPDLVAEEGESPDYDRLVGPPGVRDPRMEEQVDPTMDSRLVPSCNEPGRGVAFPPVRLVRVAQELEARGAGVTVQSICQASFTGALTEIIRQIKSALGAACLPRQLNLEADGRVSCDVVVVMPEGQECASLPGATEQLVDGVAVRENGRAVCVLTQVVGDPASGAAPADPGWYYDYYTAEGQENCENSPDEPWQRIAFTAQPPSGAEVRLECFQSVTAVGEGDITIGTFCDPEGDGMAFCGAAMNPNGTAALGCDPVSRACGVPCTDDSQCNAAGLVGYVCDTRPLSEVDPEFEGVADAHNFCVNPTCG